MSSNGGAMRVVLTSVLLAVILSFSSCSTSQAEAEVEVVDPRQAVSLIESGDYVVVDLRSAEAFAAGHVRGARSLPYLDGDFQQRVEDLHRDGKYLLYARDPRVVDQAADLLVSRGFTHVVDGGSFGLLALAGAELE